MKRCSSCRNSVEDNIKYCPTCGSSSFVYDTNNYQYQNYNQNYNQNNNQYNYQYNNQYNNQQSDSSLGSPIIWGVVGYFIPLAGLILFFMWNKTNPKHAKAAGIGALICLGMLIITMLLLNAIISPFTNGFS